MLNGINIPLRAPTSELKANLEQATAYTKKYAVDVEAYADKAVAAQERQIVKLKALSEQYGVLARSAEVSGEKQAAAAKLQADAERKLAIARGEAIRGQTAATGEMAAVTKTAGSAGMALAKSMGLWLGVPAVAVGLKKSADAANEFQAEMTKVHTQAGASTAEVSRMSKALVALGPQVGTSATVLSQGLYHLESAGSRGSAALNQLRVAAEGAKLGGANLEDVTNALNAAVVSGISGVQDLKQAMGALNATVGAGDMRMQDLADALGTGLLAKAEVFGLTIRDVGAALAVLGDNNIRGAKAGTMLASAMRIMAAPSKNAAAALGKVGIGATELADKMRSGGLPAALTDLRDKMERMGLSASQQGEVLTRAFGGKQSGAIMVLISQLDRLRLKEEEVGKGAHRFASDWAAYQKTNQAATDRFKAALQSLEIEIGGAIAPALTRATNALEKWIYGMTKSGELGKQVKSVMDAVGQAFQVAAVVVGKLDDISGSFGNTLKGLVIGLAAYKVGVYAASTAQTLMGVSGVEALTAIKASLISTGVGAAFVALGLAAEYVITHWSKVKEWFHQFAGWMEGTWRAIKATVEDLVKGMVYVVLQYVTAGVQGTLEVASHLPFVGGKAKAALHAIQDEINKFKPDWSNVANAFKAGGTQEGTSFGQNFVSSAQAQMAGLQVPGGAGGGGQVNAEAAAKGAHGIGMTGAVTMNSAMGMGTGKQKMLALAKAALGTPYLWGGAGPGGFDCSGLVMWAFSNGLNVSIPHSTYEQVKMGQQVNPSQAGIGNVVFTNYGEGGKAGPGHEGFIVGFDKNGQPIIEAAPHTGSRVQTYHGYQAFTGGAQFTVRDLLAKAAPAGYTAPPTGLPSGPGAADPFAAATKAKAYHLPQTLVAHVKKAADDFKNGVTKAHLAELVSLLRQEEALLKKHGETSAAASVAAEIADANKKLKDKIAAAHAALIRKQEQAAAKAATLAIERITAEATKPESVLKLAQAAGAPTAVVEKDQEAVLAAYQDESRRLAAKMRGTTATARQKYRSALDKVQQQVQSAQDAVVQSLQNLAQSAQSNLTNLLQTVQQQADQALGNQFYQNGLMTPSEALLKSMQDQDTQQGLQDALQNAIDQMAQDTQSGADQKTLAGDQKAIDQAQRQITENELQIKATQERTQADQQYAQAQFNLNAKLATLIQNVGDGSATMSDLNGVLGDFGIQLSGLSDPGGNGLLTQLQAAIKDTIDAFAKLTAASGGTPSGSGATGPSGSPTSTSGKTGTSAISVSHGPGGVSSNKKQGVFSIHALGGAGTVFGPHVFLAGENGPEDFMFMPHGRGSIGAAAGAGEALHIHFDGPVYADSAGIQRLTEQVYAELLRKKKRTGNLQLN